MTTGRMMHPYPEPSLVCRTQMPVPHVPCCLVYLCWVLGTFFSCKLWPLRECKVLLQALAALPQMKHQTTVFCDVELLVFVSVKVSKILCETSNPGHLKLVIPCLNFRSLL